MLREEMFALLARAVGDLKDAVLITEGERGPDGMRRIIFVNRAFTEITGFAAEEAVGALPDLTIGPDTARDALERIQSARAALVPVRVELLKYRKDKTPFWAELDVVPVLDDEGRCTHFLGVMRDVSERRLAHARLMEAERLASIGRLAAGVAHEINNPLAYMLTNIDFLQSEITALASESTDPRATARLAELQTVVSDVRSGGLRLAQIVRNVKAFARPSVADGPIDIPALLDSVIEMAKIGVPTATPVSRRYEATPVIHGNAHDLAQAFLNVIVNALQAIPGEGASGRGIEVVAGSGDDGAVVEVRDEGVGIPADVLPRIFDPLFTTKATRHGAGLGLSIAHGIVSTCGGRLTVESQVGKGTVVRVSLPAIAKPASVRG